MRELRSENANLIKQNIELRAENKYLRDELKGIGHRSPTTSEKISLEVERRFALFVWVRDRILAPTLANVTTIIVTAILYLAFGGTFPK